MAQLENRAETQGDVAAIEERREFLKKAGKVALTAPAVALLLRAGKAQAQPISGAPDAFAG